VGKEAVFLIIDQISEKIPTISTLNGYNIGFYKKIAT
jgi:hypothetical protein